MLDNHDKKSIIEDVRYNSTEKWFLKRHSRFWILDTRELIFTETETNLLASRRADSGIEEKGTFM